MATRTARTTRTKKTRRARAAAVTVRKTDSKRKAAGAAAVLQAGSGKPSGKTSASSVRVIRTFNKRSAVGRARIRHAVESAYSTSVTPEETDPGTAPAADSSSRS